MANSIYSFPKKEMALSGSETTNHHTLCILSSEL